MQPTILQVNQLVADQAVASSVVPIIMGSTGTGNLPFSYNLPALKKIYWELFGLFTLGATGGFRFLADNAGTETFYNAQIAVLDEVTPTRFADNQTTQAVFANASAVAGLYSINASGSIINGTPGGVFSLQFAQNTSDVLPITLKAGSFFKLYIL